MDNNEVINEVEVKEETVVNNEESVFNARREGRNFLATSLVAVAAIIAFIGGTFLVEEANKTFKSSPKTIYVEKEVEVEVEKEVYPTVLGFDESKITNKSENAVYSLSLSKTGEVTLKYGDTKNVILFEKNEGSSSSIFNADIVDTHFVNDKIVFLLADGTVEYILVNDIVPSEEISHSEIVELKGTAKFYDSSVCVSSAVEGEQPNCVPTVLAQKTNGEIFDLSNVQY